MPCPTGERWRGTAPIVPASRRPVARTPVPRNSIGCVRPGGGDPGLRVAEQGPEERGVGGGYPVVGGRRPRAETDEGTAASRVSRVRAEAVVADEEVAAGLPLAGEPPQGAEDDERPPA